MAMNPITNVEAVQGNKGADWVLQVRGNITVYAGGEVRTADLPDGFNPTIALFSVTVHNDVGPMKGVPTPFVIERAVSQGQYEQVTLNPGEENSVTVDIVEVKTVQ